MIIVGVDTGGTFTDFIYRKDKKWGVLKLPSTPENPAKAVIEGLQKIAENEVKHVVHGTTVATNAILEKKGAKTAFITNEGFEDIIYIGRQNRKELYNLSYRRKPPLVPEELRFGVKCRVNSKGEILEELDIKQVKDVIKKLKSQNVEAVAVSFLFSFLNDEHEKIVEKLLKKEGFYVSPSYRVIPEFREYERASTVVVNAYVMPKMEKYISFLEEKLSEKDHLRIMQSNGGSISPKTTKEEPVRTVLSGPAGGVVGAYQIGKQAGFDRLITFDMGGTSTDVSLIDRKIPFTTDTEISDMPIKVPVIDIHTVGAGGGSIAYIDEGGALNVGPESAGADPGPVCYGKGDKITVTDANLFLGRLVPEFFLGGNMKLHNNRTESYMKDLAKKACISPVELAEGIITVANAKMEKAIRVISVERGFNPQDFVLFSFGGAGGLHAVFLAKSLGIPKVFIPKNPGILSATGMLLADILKDYSTTVMLSQREAIYQSIGKLFVPLEERAILELKEEGVQNIRLEKYLDVRYKGQSFEIVIPFEKDFIELFHKEHERLYGYCDKKREVEVVNIRLRAIGEIEKPQFEEIKKGDRKIESSAVLGEKDIIFGGKSVKTKIIDRDKLLANNVIDFPAVVVEYSSTTVIPPGAKGEVDIYGNLIIDV